FIVPNTVLNIDMHLSTRRKKDFCIACYLLWGFALFPKLRSPGVLSLMSLDDGRRYASVSNGCQEGKVRDGVVPQTTLLPLTAVPKRQTLNPLQSQKSEGWTKSLRDSFSLVSFGRCVLDTTTCRGGRGAMVGMGVCDRAVDMRR